MSLDTKQLAHKVPAAIRSVVETLQKEGYEAYLVGGCVRDLLREATPKDWDVTTNAIPDTIQELFDETFYENDFGTVGVILRNVTHETAQNTDKEVTHGTHDEPIEDSRKISRETPASEENTVPRETATVVEVTPYRLEAKYSDDRHPDSVSFSKNIEDDLKRRDFTVNAIAYDPIQGHVIDLYGGMTDMANKTLRAVGEAEDRFNEDALRILRAVRLSTELGFAISTETQEAILQTKEKLERISTERIRDEFSRILMSDNPMGGVILMQRLGIFRYIIPELEVGIGVEQNGDHIYDVWEHNLRALNHSAERNWPLHIRLGALLHDVSKPETRRWSKEKNDYTFYGHDVVGGRVAKKILTRLKYPKKTIEDVEKLVRWHLFFTDIDKITLSAVRRLVKNVGPDLVWDLMKVRACDRIGMGRPKEKPYRLRKYEAMIEEAMRAPVSVGMLKIDGKRIMDILQEKPGPRLGWMLHALLEDVLDDPKRNTEEYLEDRVRELAKLPDETLKQLGEKGKEEKEKKEAEEVGKIRKKHWVK